MSGLMTINHDMVGARAGSNERRKYERLVFRG
jgi:hypothetical protein